MDLNNKRIIVMGAGVSGIAAAKLANKMGAQMILSDNRKETEIKYDLNELRANHIEVILGKQTLELLQRADLLIISPAVPRHLPILEEVAARGIKIISEIEFAWQIAKSPIYAITGTNGKTTTTMLLGQLMGKKYADVGIGGNIGTSLCEEAYRIGADSCIVAEISSYQLEAVDRFRPHIAAVLNVTPDHMARHGSMQVYQETKEKIFARQTVNDYLILNYDDERTRSMQERAKSKIVFFSHVENLDEGIVAWHNNINLKWQGKEYFICHVDEIKIKGTHNLENALAAAAMAFFAGVAVEDITAVLKKFPGVEHRIEPVITIDGVEYFNDSKATNTDAAIKALNTFNGGIILIAGGHDKKTDLTGFMQLAKQKVDKLILLGDAAKRFEAEALKNGIVSAQIMHAGYSMQKAVQLAHDCAKKPQVVLLSPACSSFDMYDGYEERGRDFKKIVRALVKADRVGK